MAVWDFDLMTDKKFADGSGNGFHASIIGRVASVPEGIIGRAVNFDGTGYLRVDEPFVFNVPDLTVSLWVKPTVLSGRRGLITKRYTNIVAPFVISHSRAIVSFEAAEESGVWSFNFNSPALLKEGEWTHIVAVVRRGEGVTLYINGQAVAEIKNPAPRATNTEPLILGRDAWGGDPPRGDTPGFYVGLMDEVKIWARPLTAEEVKAEFEKGRKGK